MQVLYTHVEDVIGRGSMLYLRSYSGLECGIDYVHLEMVARDMCTIVGAQVM